MENMWARLASLVVPFHDGDALPSVAVKALGQLNEAQVLTCVSWFGWPWNCSTGQLPQSTMTGHEREAVLV